MSSSVEPGITVGLEGDEIVVRKPGTAFLIAFKSHPNQRHLVVTRCWLAGFSSKPLAEFRAMAAQLALDQARLLGWIVEANNRKKARRGPLLRLVKTR